jgi:hypothetical protein
MVQQIVTIPDKDLTLFLELAKKFKWKVDKEASSNFVLTPEQLTVLEERSKTPFSECISKEEFFNTQQNTEKHPA